MRTLLLLLGVVMGCRSTGPFEGAWRSDRDMTLKALSQVSTIGDVQRERLAKLEFFGHMLHVFSGSRWLTVFDNQCTDMAQMKGVVTGPRTRSVTFFNPVAKRVTTTTMEVDGDTLWVTIPLLPPGSREAFRRISLDEARRAHPCLSDLL